MDAEKRKTIVYEIEHWRKSKLLPEHYCDFLLNLYLEDPSERPKSGGSFSTATIRNSNWKVWLLSFGGLGLISFVALNFNSFQIPMQISISALIILLCYMMGGVMRVKNPIASYIGFGFGSVLLLNAGLYLLEKNNADMFFIISYAALSSIIWMVTGITARMPIFHFGGWLVLMLIYGWILQHNIDSFDWLGLQMSWVPISIVLIWLGWLFHHNNKQMGSVLLLVGLFVWFVPDIYGMILTDLPQSGLQFSLIARIILAGILLFTLRKKWTEWVA
ncbi:MAG: hypothetical protein JWM44_331 [Bacilli bacterium]|nr:hypothetical protein [Bacilli bacterium]